MSNVRRYKTLVASSQKSMKKALALAPLALLIAASPVLAQTTRPESIPPEGYTDASGRLILPLRKVLANRRLMVRDMGSAFAACPSTHQVLAQIQNAMLSTEAKDLEARGYSSKDYVSFWNESFEEGKKTPVPASQCESETSSWKTMLKNIEAK